MAERFGWTPEQVDNLPAETADWLIAIGNMVQEIKSERAEQVVLMGAIVVKNMKDVINAIDRSVDNYEQAAQYGISMAALAIERQAKLNANTGTHKRGQGHNPGTGPGPNVVTGTLRRSITTEIRYGFGSYIATIGPTVEYARAVELGNPRWKSGVRYPFLVPAVGYLVGSGKLNNIFTTNFKSRLRG